MSPVRRSESPLANSICCHSWIFSTKWLSSLTAQAMSLELRSNDELSSQICSYKSPRNQKQHNLSRCALISSDAVNAKSQQKEDSIKTLIKCVHSVLAKIEDKILNNFSFTPLTRLMTNSVLQCQ